MKLTNRFFKTACTNCGLCDGLIASVSDYSSADDCRRLCRKAAKKKEFVTICPGIGIDRSQFDMDCKYHHPTIGAYTDSFVGYSKDSAQRRSSSSGGILTEILCFLIEQDFVDAICLPLPVDLSETTHQYYLTKDIIRIREAAQSIYSKVPAWGIINDIRGFEGRVAFVGLPDQVASIRAYQSLESILKRKIKYLVGPMVGICMDHQIIDMIPALARRKKSEIKKLRWRYGEWPGYLKVDFDDGSFEIPKFHYNYLLPFYCSHESLLSDDFSNEGTDIAVGDAWSPEYEKLGGGWSIVWAKTIKGNHLLNHMAQKNIVKLGSVSADDAARMHEHMLDFKKRGAKYRAAIYNFFNFPTPKTYSPEPQYRISRYIIELIITFVVWICRAKVSRWLLPNINQNMMGKLFSALRVNWKRLTKKIKRKGLDQYGS